MATPWTIAPKKKAQLNMEIDVLNRDASVDPAQTAFNLATSQSTTFDVAHHGNGAAEPSSAPDKMYNDFNRFRFTAPTYALEEEWAREVSNDEQRERDLIMDSEDNVFQIIHKTVLRTRQIVEDICFRVMCLQYNNAVTHLMPVPFNPFNNADALARVWRGKTGSVCLDHLKGVCTSKRARCKYHHPQLPENIKTEDGQQICTTWALTKFCKFGDMCRDAHPENCNFQLNGADQIVEQTPPQQNIPNLAQLQMLNYNAMINAGFLNSMQNLDFSYTPMQNMQFPTYMPGLQ